MQEEFTFQQITDFADQIMACYEECTSHKQIANRIGINEKTLLNLYKKGSHFKKFESIYFAINIFRGHIKYHNERENLVPSPFVGYDALIYAHDNGCPLDLYRQKANITMAEFIWLNERAFSLGMIKDKWWSNNYDNKARWEKWNPGNHLPGSMPQKSRKKE